jgi:DNA mismatch repair ATPase MutS
MVMHTAKKDRIRLPFEVDTQTWKDIDLFDKGGVGPAFTLFCRVKTAGGAEALERMLKNPSNHRALLEGRRDIIRFFCDAGVDLPIGREQLKKVESYLSSVFPRLPDSRPKILLFSIRNQLQKQPVYFAIIQGIRTTVSLLRHLFQLRESWLDRDCPAMLMDELEGLPESITDRRVRELILGESRHLTPVDLACCDRYFRGSGKVFLRRLLQMLYDWDVFEAVAMVVQQYDLCFPQYNDAPDPVVEVQGLFSPLLAGGVCNDLELGGDTNLCFITGAGMAGKSTFLKSFGLAVYLAHIGFPVPAHSFRTTIFNGLITTVDLGDSIGQGYSRCYAEVNRIKETLRQIKEKRRVLVIFDELFRGTPAKDAGGALLQVADALAGIGDSLFLVSTSIGEIADGLQGNPNIRFACFESTMEGGVPWYSYRLREGVSNERMGMLLLRNEGVLEMLEGMQTSRISRDAG